MTTESRNSLLLGNVSKTYSCGRERAQPLKSGISVVSAALVAMQRCGKHISAAVNQQATIEEEVFSVGAARCYITRVSTARIRIESSFGVGSRRRLRRMARKILGYAKNASCVT
jgi:hypothetical protein